MTTSSARGITRSRVALLALMALSAIGMSACSSSDGKNGATGAPGTPGATGPTGPAGPPGPGATTEPRESCAVCHDDGSVYAVTDMHAMAPVITVSAPVFTPSGNDLVVTFNVKADGVNFTALTTAARAYQFNGALRNTLNSIDASVPGDVVTTATLAGGTSGNYTITITDGFLVYGAIPSRYLFRLETALGSAEPRAMVMGNYPSAPDEELVGTAGCTGCHSTMGNGFHYGYPTSGQNCTVCHDADNTTYPRLINIGHGIHNSEQMPGGSYDLKTTTGGAAGTFAVTYPTFMTNCSVCHTAASGALAKVNQMPVTGEGCLSCHGTMASWEENFAASGATFHEAYDETTDCTACHNAAPDAAAPGLVHVTDFHNGLETEMVGIIEDGVDTSVTEGKRFTWQITSVTDSAADANRVITWTATFDGNPVDPCNSTAAAGAPVFFNFPAGVVLDGQPGMLTTYMQGNDYILGQATNEPGQPVNVNLTTANTTCSGNVATTTIARGTVPAGATVGIVALQGKPALPLPANVDTAVYPYTYMYVRVPTPTYQFVVGTGALSSDVRRTIVDTDKCTTCHVGSLYQHGNTRVDNALMCTVCHNSASSEQSVRYGMGVTASEAYDGLVGQTFELKTMLHRIHTAGEQTEAAPFVIYRNRGIYAWAPNTAMIPNWDATLAQTPCGTGEGGVPKYLVYGADPANPNSCQPFNFFEPTYPRLFNDCYACHTAGAVDNTPLQSEAVATTLDAGSIVWQNQIDDTLQGASAAACTSCHTSTAAKGHAYQNGWVPQVFPEGRQTILDTP